jgi:hypothetical protein
MAPRSPPSVSWSGLNARRALGDLHVREASLEAKAMQQSRAGFGSGWFVVHGGERSIWSRQYACSGYAVAQRRSGTRNCTPRGGNFRRHLGDIPCLRQGNPSRPAARLRLWWWLLPVREGVLVRVRKRCLFAFSGSDQTGAQESSTKVRSEQLPRGGIGSQLHYVRTLLRIDAQTLDRRHADPLSDYG